MRENRKAGTGAQTVRKFARARRGSPLAEYVILLVSILLVSIGAVTLLGTRITTIFHTTVDVVDTPPALASASPDGPYDPGGGYVTATDVAHGCPLVEGVEYFSDNKTTELPGWSHIVLDPDAYGPGDPLPGLVFLDHGVGGWWFDADTTDSAATTVNLPVNATYDLYPEKLGEYATYGLFAYGFQDRVSFSTDDMASYRFCSDRSKDGVSAPVEVGNTAATASTVEPGTDGSHGAATAGYIDSDGDTDWHRVDVPGPQTALQVTITSLLVQGREAFRPGVRIVDASGNTLSDPSSLTTTSLASGIAVGAIYLEALNDSTRYAGMGGYEVQARYVQDTPYPTAQAGAMTLGVDVEEDILEGDAGDTFTFTTTGEQTVQFVAAGINTGLKSVKLSLFDATGTEMDTQTATDQAAIVGNALPAGTYYLRVEPGAADTRIGDYRLSSSVVVDTPYPTAQAGAMTLGVDVVEDILEGDAGDTFTFTTGAEDTVQFVAAGINTGLDSVKLSLFDGTGAVMDTDSGADRAAIVASPLAAGTYFVRVEPDATDARLGDYRLSSGSVADTPFPTAQAAPMTLGVDIEEDILEGDAGDTFTFTTSAPTTMEFTVTGINTGLESIKMSLLDNAGGVVDTGFGNDTASIVASPLAAGTYYLRVEPYLAGTRLGDYRLSSVDISDSPDSFAGATPIALNEVVQEDIKTGDDGDMFKLTTSSEMDLLFHVEGVGPTPLEEVDVTVYDASGTELASKAFVRAWILLNHQPAGDYYIRVDKRYSSTTLGDYELTVTEADDVSPEFARAQPLVFGTPFSEDFIAYVDRDMFSFTNPVGQHVRIKATAPDYIRFWVYDASETEIASSSSSTSPAVFMRDLPAGDYYVQTDARYNDLMDYTLIAEHVEDAPSSFAEATAISVGTRHSEDIATTSDVDMFRFTLSTTQSIDVDLSNTSTYMRLTLYDGSQTSLSSRTGKYGITISQTDLPPGDYYVKVETQYSYTSDYDLDVTSVGGP